MRNRAQGPSGLLSIDYNEGLTAIKIAVFGKWADAGGKNGPGRRQTLLTRLILNISADWSVTVR